MGWSADGRLPYRNVKHEQNAKMYRMANFGLEIFLDLSKEETTWVRWLRFFAVNKKKDPICRALGLVRQILGTTNAFFLSREARVGRGGVQHTKHNHNHICQAPTKRDTGSHSATLMPLKCSFQDMWTISSTLMFAQSGDVCIWALERQAVRMDPEDTNIYSLNYDWPPFGEADAYSGED